MERFKKKKNRMKRFLLLALTAGLLSPIAANAERFWLILNSSNDMQRIEVENMDQCLEQGEVFHKSNKTMKRPDYNLGYACIKGK